ncbi:DUF2185 domain-containing protein [Thalassotalea mangrovi]|uniref:DUF2185 domain-containing protein n=2 Tax=Thalassotalea mangrovi TaxID=2572245 RepID=A0A4V5NTY3_9GAMM|nr:DUF2185 domain-containing protein [Thalassotalea mangrovi]
MDKRFKLSNSEIKPLAIGFGACIASDMITVDGCQVGFMYRESPINEVDSGWRFLSGLESQDYMDNANNHSLYDINTVANYDPDITSFIELPIGSQCERNSDGTLEEIKD